MPRVSVLMVFHRDTAFLRPAIASILRQDFADFELLLVDNGTGLGPDALGELGRDPRLRWVRLPRNAGIPAGHNAGVAAARGELVALIDYDDRAKPHRLSRQVAALSDRPEVGVVSGFAEQIDENDRPTGRVFCLPRADEHAIYSPYGGPIVLATAMARREVLTAFPYRPEFPFAADLDFQARASERTTMLVLPDVLLSYRWYGAQTTQQRRADIECSRCALQIAAARRRAGREEDLARLVEALRAPSPAESWRQGARLCLAEREWVFAAYQARRSLACDRSPGSALVAVRLARRAWRQARGPTRAAVRRMFFRGPVRALGLHPA